MSETPAGFSHEPRQRQDSSAQKRPGTVTELEAAFPGWHVYCDSGGTWTATYVYAKVINIDARDPESLALKLQGLYRHSA
jgi:hypothetical protein